VRVNALNKVLFPTFGKPKIPAFIIKYSVPFTEKGNIYSEGRVIQPNVLKRFLNEDNEIDIRIRVTP